MGLQRTDEFPKNAVRMALPSGLTRRQVADFAGLIGTDGRSVVGLVYRWYSGGLAVKWEDGPKRVTATKPELTDAEMCEIDFDGLANMREEQDGLD